MPITIALMVSYSICLIVAGHGAVPLGMLLFVGGMDSWFIAGKALGWLGMAGLLLAAVGLRRNSRAQRILQLASAIVLYASWFDIARRTDNESGSFGTTAIFSIPFQVVFLGSVAWLVIQLKRSWAPRSAAS